MSVIVLPVDHDISFKRYMDALLEGDARVLSALVDNLLAEKVPLNTVYRDFIQRGMYEIGVLWERNKIPVSVEHLAASATQSVLSKIYLKLPSYRENSPEVIIACVANEMHDVGTMVVANLCEFAGWKSVLLGANTPTRDMLRYIEQRKHMPDLLALSITLPANRVSLEVDLAAITEKFPSLKIVIGGQALNGHPEAIQFRKSLLTKYSTVDYMPTLDEFEHFLNALASRCAATDQAGKKIEN